MQTTDLTGGNLFRGMMYFSIPYLISSFLQTFYGMADLFITGQFNGAAAVSGVSVGSQVTHMLTVIIVGLAMGTTVTISRSVGSRKPEEAARFIGNSITIFTIMAAALTAVLLLCTTPILHALSVPKEAWNQAKSYLMICFAGIPFITAYNVISSIFRGMGDTRHPMYYVAIAGVLNIGLDYLFIGPFEMGAAGAALATVISQAFSVVIALFSLRHSDFGIHLRREDLRLSRTFAGQIMSIGVPISCQDGLIQVSFMVITAIANSRGVDVSAAVGIVEKIISFLFLVPSSMLSTISAVSAQNLGAGKAGRSRLCLRYGMTFCLVYGVIVFILCQIFAAQIVGIFVTDEPEVVRLGAQYLHSYSLDCILAGIHFCFSGYFSSCGKSIYSFIHNIIAIITVRIPGAWLASVYFPDTLLPMGLAAPMGSLLSSVICIFLYRHLRKQDAAEDVENA